MHASASTRADQPAPFPRWLIVLFFKCISRHAKRVFYISSLNGYLNHFATQHRLAATRLNEVMRLAYREETLHQSESLSTQVWGDTGLESVVTEEVLAHSADEAELQALAGRVVDISPRWARFAKTRQEMVDGIAEMLRSRRSVLLSAA